MYLSAFDLFRIGPGPSSCSTVGPQRAALRFAHELAADGLVPATAHVEVETYGGLAFTGREQATDRAILAGLSGEAPERCDATVLAVCTARVEVEGGLLLGGRHRVEHVPSRDLRFKVNHSIAVDGNAVRFIARDANGAVVASRVYLSTGNGAITAEGEAAGGHRPRIPYIFESAEELLRLGRGHGKKVADIARANECALRSPAEVKSGLLRIALAMHASLERGLATDGILPGGAMRRASAQRGAQTPARQCATYATAVAEENAAGGRVVSAPSNGSAGPVAALLQAWRDSGPLHAESGTLDFLLAGAAIGHLLRASGVERAGCQGEVGVACAMAAAGFAAVLNGSNTQIVYAAERALEPHLGLACDPSGGRVQEPCIERNAAAGARAYDAAMAAVRTPDPRNSLDRLANSMVESSRAMSARYKVASIGGVAVNIAEC